MNHKRGKRAERKSRSNTNYQGNLKTKHSEESNKEYLLWKQV